MPNNLGAFNAAVFFGKPHFSFHRSPLNLMGARLFAGASFEDGTFKTIRLWGTKFRGEV